MSRSHRAQAFLMEFWRTIIHDETRPLNCVGLVRAAALAPWGSTGQLPQISLPTRVDGSLRARALF